MTGWCSGYSAEVIAFAMFCQLVREFQSHPVHFLILFQNFEKLSSNIGVSSNLVWAQKTSYPTISAHSALGHFRGFWHIFSAKMLSRVNMKCLIRHKEPKCKIF